jgi:flagellar hook-basal body complex protein FliE
MCCKENENLHQNERNPLIFIKKASKEVKFCFVIRNKLILSYQRMFNSKVAHHVNCRVN